MNQEEPKNLKNILKKRDSEVEYCTIKCISNTMHLLTRVESQCIRQCLVPNRPLRSIP